MNQNVTRLAKIKVENEGTSRATSEKFKRMSLNECQLVIHRFNGGS